MRLTEFQDKHEGDLTGPALEEIKNRQQALKQQQLVPPATGERHRLLLSTQHRLIASALSLSANSIHQRVTGCTQRYLHLS